MALTGRSVVFLTLLVFGLTRGQDYNGFVPEELRSVLGIEESPLIPTNGLKHSRPTQEKATSVPKEPSYYRLPNTTVPEEYNITLTIYPYQWSFWGETTIRIRAMEDTDTVVLHSYSHSFGLVSVREIDGDEFNVTYKRTSDDRNFLTIELQNDTLVKDSRYELVFNFSAPFASYLAGLYRSSYINTNGTRRYLATTQFEPTNARDAFPCYDEPALKAIFNLNIYAPTGYYAISNMDRIPTTLPPNNFNYTAYSFRSSPRMSTYLLAFVVSDFEYVSNSIDGPQSFPKEYRVYAKPGNNERLKYALEFGQKSIEYLQEYTGVNYRLPKVDNIGIPDFAAGAMENWGLVTYQERYLYYTKGITDTPLETFLNLIISHETAHFWFGDEVSPKWWDYLWLSEGFATFLASYATDKVYNDEWRLMEQFVVSDIHNVMWSDSFASSNAMTNSVNSPTEIGQNFNAIAYSKAASVIRMMQHVLGNERFRSSLSNYLKSLPVGAATPEDLYNAMHAVTVGTGLLPANVTMNEIFGSWADQAGYPILNVTRRGSTLTLTQERYVEGRSGFNTSRWWIPLTWATSSNPSFTNTTPMDWFSPSEEIMKITIDQGDAWYMLNLQQMGYYRVMYEEENWKSLITALKERIAIHPLNKAQLLNDAFIFSRKGTFRYKVLMDLLSYLEVETDFIPWRTASSIVSFLNGKIKGSERYHLYKKFVEKIIDSAYEDVGFEVNDTDVHVTKRSRSVAVRIACEAGVQKCVQKSQEAINREMVDPMQRVDPDLQSAIFCSGLRNGTKSMWDFVLDKYNKSNSDDEKLRAIGGLGCTENDDIMDSYFEMILNSSSKIQRVDKEYALRSVVGAGQYGVERVLNLLQNNFTELRPNIASSQGTYRIIVTLGIHIVTEEHRQAFETFATTYENDFGEYERVGLKTARLYINDNKYWLERNGGDIEEWLTENV